VAEERSELVPAGDDAHVGGVVHVRHARLPPTTGSV
jgi:hypothetical protein